MIRSASIIVHRALLPSMLAALVAASGFVLLTLIAPTVDAQTAVGTLGGLKAFAGEDPRADYGRIRIPRSGWTPRSVRTLYPMAA